MAMSRRVTFRCAMIFAAIMAWPSCGIAAEASPGPERSEPSKPAAQPTKPMKEDEPMAGEMKKKGMKKGDVKQWAEKHDEKMREMMKNEEMKK